ncbi:MAG: DUF6261 family protein [Lentisphaeria bacterium]
MKEIIALLNKANMQTSNIAHSFKKFCSTIECYQKSYDKHLAIGDDAISIAETDFQRDCIMQSIILIAHAHENDTHADFSEVSADVLKILKKIEINNLKRQYSQNTNNISNIIEAIIGDDFIQYVKYTGLVPWIAKLEKINHKTDLMLIANPSLEQAVIDLPTLSTIRIEADRSFHILLKNLDVYQHIIESQLAITSITIEINSLIDKYNAIINPED